MKAIKFILFFVLLPIFGPIYLLLNLVSSWWEGLLD